MPTTVTGIPGHRYACVCDRCTAARRDPELEALLAEEEAIEKMTVRMDLRAENLWLSRERDMLQRTMDRFRLFCSGGDDCEEGPECELTRYERRTDSIFQRICEIHDRQNAILCQLRKS